MAKTSASYTIMDFNDGVTLISKISSNHPDTLAYDPATGTYNPSWASSALALTPSAYVAGVGTDIISSCSNKTWSYRRTGSTTWTPIVTGENGFTINSSSVLGYTSNVLFDSSHSTLEFQFTFTYHDDTLNIDFDQEVTKTFTRISNGTSVVIARAWSEEGEQFKNGSIPSSILLQSELLRGVTNDTTSLTYQWQKYSGGVWGNITSATSSSYTVLPSNVDGLGQFRCNIKDTDSSSDTYNVTFTSNGVSILDLTDPYQAVISSSTGSVIKNGSGSSTLTCQVYQNGTEVNSGITYTWSATDANGDAISLTGHTTNAKTFSVTSDLIDVKATFTCEVN